jgi:hypothetical protein
MSMDDYDDPDYAYWASGQAAEDAAARETAEELAGFLIELGPSRRVRRARVYEAARRHAEWAVDQVWQFRGLDEDAEEIWEPELSAVPDAALAAADLAEVAASATALAAAEHAEVVATAAVAHLVDVAKALARSNGEVRRRLVAAGRCPHRARPPGRQVATQPASPHGPPTRSTAPVMGQADLLVVLLGAAA